MSTRSARLALLFSSTGHFFTHLLMLLFPTVVLALEGQWGLGYGDLLSLSLGGFILYGLGALPAGWLADRWSVEGMMAVFFVGSGVAAVATGLADGPLAVALGLGAIGLFGSIYHPVGTAWMIRNAQSRGRALGWNGVAGSIGFAVAPLFAGAVTQLIDWRAAFVIPGVLCLAIGVVLLGCLRRGAIATDRRDRVPQPEASRTEVVRAFVVLSVTMMLVGTVSQAIGVALPKAFAEGLPGLIGGSTLGAGGYVTAVFLVAATAQLAGGWVADHFPLKGVYVLCWAAQVPLLVIAAQGRDFVLLLSIAAADYLQTLATPAENALLAAYTPAKWRATAYGAKFVLALGVSTIGVKLVALIHDETQSFFWLWLSLALCALVSAVASFFLPGRLWPPLQGRRPVLKLRRRSPALP
jgi:MFS family permease